MRSYSVSPFPVPCNAWVACECDKTITLYDVIKTHDKRPSTGGNIGVYVCIVCVCIIVCKGVYIGVCIGV